MDASKNHKTDRKYDNKKFDNKKFQDKKPHDRKFHDKKFDKGGNFVPFRGDQTRERNGGKVGLEGDGDVLPPKINELQRKLNYLADLKSKVGEQSEDYICAKTCVDKCAYDSTQTPSIIQAPNALDAPFRKGKKSKFAFTVAYRGTGYRGLQINKDTNTIELELVRAFHAAGFIDAFQLDDMHKVKWTRAARTDKGVHAAANTIALNIRVLPDQMYPEVAALRQRVLPLLQQRQDALVAALQSHLTKLNIAVPDAFLRAEVGVLPYGEVRVPAELSALLADNGVDVAALQTPAELNVNEREDQLLRLNFCESKRPRVPVDYAALRGLDADAVAAQLQSLETQRKAALEEHLATMESRTTLASNAVNKEDEENEFFSVEDQALMYNSDFASDSICSAVNAFLPAQIRLLRATRALNSFDSKLNATSRTYEYIMPSFAFIPLNQYPAGLYDLMIERVPPLSTLGAEEEQRVLALMERDSEGKVVRDEDEAGEEKGRKRGQADDDLESEEKDDAEVEKAAASRAAALAAAAGDMDAIASVRGLAPLPAEFRNYRMSAEDRARVDAILSVFHGTHNHHNFTKGRQPNNPSCSRFINSFKTTGFFYKDGVEFVHVVVHGQSFMLHQIRKMIGYTVGVARGTLDADAAKNFFSKQRYRVPIAPALGLLLDHVHFRTYDLKVAETTDKVHLYHFHIPTSCHFRIPHIICSLLLIPCTFVFLPTARRRHPAQGPRVHELRVREVSSCCYALQGAGDLP